MIAEEQDRPGRIARPATALDAEGAAIVVAAIAFVIGALIFLPFFWRQELAIAGPSSLSQYTAIVAGVVAFAAYIAGRLIHRRSLSPFGTAARPVGQKTSWVDIFDTIVIAIAHGIIALLGWLVLGALLAASFKDATVYFLSATALAGVAIAVTAYAVFLSATHMGLMRLSTVLAGFAIIGLLTSMLSAPDPHWWKLHLSALGMSNSISSLTFNITLIVAGLMMAAISRYATDVRTIDDPATKSAAMRLRVGLILIGLLLACVGIFPLDVSRILHNVSAVGMLITFTLVVFWVRKALPTAPRSFFVFGYVSFAVIVVMAVFYVVGYYVLTATELVAGAVVFGWLLVYLRVSGAAQRD
ncbi:DUF998 domain-containing protein [Planctomonas sp. JC2975]|uniref:DUF998 domain-containing protein n=1 Tax=Planctomonas sp. JC2975 TaxID=2729626 RepID=UPI0014767589|nr:DUF998 domain-containing protein [Planctomonas sp. JC2975]NNC11640.1 DUF998 domain-containing protein [Planctomonas sp. JC2975]